LSRRRNRRASCRKLPAVRASKWTPGLENMVAVAVGRSPLEPRWVSRLGQ
jgi:hypothetical protein